MKWNALIASALAAALPACGSEYESGEPLPWMGQNGVSWVDGDAFESSFGSLEVASDWSWQLGTTGEARESGRCGYERDPASPTTGRWQARFSRSDSARDPVTNQLYPHGHFAITADGTFVQVSVDPAPSAAYRCSRVDPAAATALSLHLELALGLEPDGLHVQGYVTRLFVVGIGAPIDVTTGRPVMIGYSIPAPLLIQGTVRAASNDGTLVLALEGSAGTRAPEFAFGLGLGVRGMSAATRIRFEELRLLPAPSKPPEQ